MSRLIDAHVHFWDPTARHHEWLKAEPRLDKSFLPSDLGSTADAPDGVIFIEADCRGDESLSEAEWVASLAEAGAPITGIVAHAPIEVPDALAAFLEAARKRPLIVGVRRLLQHEPDELLRNPLLIEGHRLLAGHDLTSDICITADQLPAVTTLVNSCPETTFVLDHVGKPTVGSAALEPWRSDLQRLAALENVACKLSGLATLTPRDWLPEDLLPYLQHAIEVFGPDRCLFASDWPILDLNGSYERWLAVVDEATSRLTANERDGIFAENAVRVYRLDCTQYQEGNVECS